METIEFFDCARTEPVSHIWNGAPKCYPHEVIQRAAGIHEEIIRHAPAGSALLNVGAGKRFPFNPDAVERKKIDCIDIDFDRQAIGAVSDFVRAKVGVDLASIPDNFFDADNLTEAIQSQAERVPQLRERAVRLLENLEKPVGTVVFSHVLRYLPPARVQQIVNLALRSVASHGSLWILDSGARKEAGFEEALCGIPDPAGWAVKDELLIPWLTREEAGKCADLLDEGKSSAATELYCSLVAGDPSRLARKNFRPELANGEHTAHNGYVFLTGNAERVMRLTKRTNWFRLLARSW